MHYYFGNLHSNYHITFCDILSLDAQKNYKLCAYFFNIAIGQQNQMTVKS